MNMAELNFVELLDELNGGCKEKKTDLQRKGFTTGFTTKLN